MAPPELTRNTPISNTVHPDVPSFLKLFWNYFQGTGAHRFSSSSSHFVTLDIPKREKKLDQFLKKSSNTNTAYNALIYHCGFTRGSTTSFERLHMGITIGLSFISINRFLFVISLVIATLASNLFIPCNKGLF